MEQKKNLIFFGEYRCRLEDKNTLIINTGSNDEIMAGATASAVLDGKEVSVKIVRRDTIRSRMCYRAENVFFSCEYQLCVKVTEEFEKLTVTIHFGEKYENAERTYEVDGKRYRQFLTTISGAVDFYEETDSGYRITGWAADKNPVAIKVFSGAKELECEVKSVFRQDIYDYYQEGEINYAAGFEILLPNKRHKAINIRFISGEKVQNYKMNVGKPRNQAKMPIAEAFSKVVAYTKKYGFSTMVSKAYRKLTKGSAYDYNDWILDRSPSEEELLEQKNTNFEYNPKFSIVIPVYRPVPRFFTEMIRSIKNQTYDNFEICIADGGGEGHTMEKELYSEIKGDRVRYVKLEKNLGISGNTNEALKLATGDYIVLGDHDDIITRDALYECARAINEDRTIDVIYSDEDKISEDSKKRRFPNFKPDFNIDLLRTSNYICHLFVFSKEIYEKVGGFRSEFDGAQDYDMILRCTETAKNIYHIPKILYSWRLFSGSTSANPEAKKYAFIAGAKAIQSQLDRLSIKGTVTIDENIPGFYHTTYELTSEPLVSVLIPNKDHTDDLDICIRSIVDKQDYTNYEIIVIENNSTEPETFEYYKKISDKYDKVRVVYWKDSEKVGFNYSKINNYGANEAKGEYFLLLNNDTEMIKGDCLRQLLSHAMRPEVGIVGARLLYEDDTIQHAGVVIGFGGIAGHCFVGNDLKNYGYQNYAVAVRDYSAVTAACLMVRKEVFYEVEGLDEGYAVAFNDVDFCLKVRDKGYLVVYNAEAVLHHYESKSRGYEDTPEKIARFEGEALRLYTKWNDFLKKGDPYYNPNLTLTKCDFSLKEK